MNTVIDWLIERAEAGDLAGQAAEGLQLAHRRGPVEVRPADLHAGRAGQAGLRLHQAQAAEAVPHPIVEIWTTADEIYQELVQGRIVIVDLHLGPDATIRQLSENLAGYLMERQTESVHHGRGAAATSRWHLEEAHNLFSSDKYKNELDVWVRMAKQASKLKIGMLYATQEVTGVAHQVLANTKNWVVAHLNNSREVNELGKFYDFKAFGDAIISHEDKGYVRLKTMFLAVYRSGAHRPVRDRTR